MERDNERELLEKLSEEIEKLRERGISQGLNDGEINKYILECTNQENPEDDKVWKPGKEGGSRRCRRLCLYFIASWFVLTLVLVGAYYVVDSHEPTKAFLSRSTASWGHPLFRQIRLLGLPFNQYLSDYYDDACLVNNPFFREETVLEDCRHCQNVNTVKFRPAISVEQFSDDFYHQGGVLFTKDSQGATVTLLQLQTHCASSLTQIKTGFNRVTFWDGRVDSVDNFLKNITSTDVVADHSFHVEWYSRRIGASQILRKLFRRPSFLPPEAESDSEKSVYVDNTRAPPFGVGNESFPGGTSVWYQQSTGSRLLRLRPVQACAHHCSPVDVTLSAGQLLFFSRGFWEATSHPVSDESEISLAFVASFV